MQALEYSSNNRRLGGNLLVSGGRDAAHGFSLIEILVALLILSMITATLWTSFARSVDVQENTRAIDERNHEVRIALDRMARELSMAYLEGSQAAVTANRHQTLFLAINIQDTDRVDFSAFAHLKIIEDAKEGDACEISYYTENVGDQLALIRREDPQMDDQPDSGGNRMVFLEDITALNLRYYDPRKNEWVEEWDSRSAFYRNQLPAEVEIKISYKNHRGNVVSLQTRTLIYLMEALN